MRAFQAKQNLQTDGAIADKTWQVLVELATILTAIPTFRLVLKLIVDAKVENNVVASTNLHRNLSKQQILRSQLGLNHLPLVVTPMNTINHY